MFMILLMCVCADDQTCSDDDADDGDDSSDDDDVDDDADDDDDSHVFENCLCPPNGHFKRDDSPMDFG